MEIQWFPGHMSRTIREIKENLSKVDVVIEILDGRIPFSSCNPVVSELISNKPRLIVLNKCDLSDPVITDKWMNYFSSLPNTNAIKVSSKTLVNLNSISDSCLNLCKNEKWIARREVRGMVVGIPNVGKSTIINALSKKKKVITGNKPGVTRNMTRISVSNHLQIYDTPGVLWHKFEDEISGLNLAALGSIKDTILDLSSISLKILQYLTKKYPKYIKDRYNISEIPEDSNELLSIIGLKRGCLLPGGIIDTDRAVAFLLKDLREGRLGMISLEEPEDIEDRLLSVELKRIEKAKKQEEREINKRKNRRN